MKKIIIFILSCICYLFVTSCGKTYCPGFPEYLASYLPYTEYDILSFVNQKNDTIKLQVNGIVKQKEHSISHCGKCECEEPALYVNADNLNIFISAGLKLGAPHICFSLYNKYLGDTVSYSEQHYSVLEVYNRDIKDPFNPQNGAIFGDTVIIEDNNKQISKVIIVNGKGIIGFYDKKYDFQWKSIYKI